MLCGRVILRGYGSGMAGSRYVSRWFGKGDGFGDAGGMVVNRVCAMVVEVRKLSYWW